MLLVPRFLKSIGDWQNKKRAVSRAETARVVRDTDCYSCWTTR